MKYSNYFKPIIRDGGMINFIPQEQLRILNIGALEYNIQSLKGVKNRNKGKDEFFKYDLDIFKQESKLADLTGNLEPNKKV